MAKILRFLLLISLIAFLSPVCYSKEYPYRWVYVSRRLNEDSDVREISGIVKMASEHGLNGMVLSAGLDRLDQQRPTYFRRLEQVKQICKQYNIEIIPIVFSVGYGGAILAHDRNLAAAVPVKDAVFVVRGGQAHLLSDSSVRIVNGGFEEHYGDHLPGYRFHDKPGEVSFVDTTVFRSGMASLRFENFQNFRHGHGRVMQEVKVQPHRSYKVTCWIKTDRLTPTSALRMLVLAPDKHQIAESSLELPSTVDWRKVDLDFNSFKFDKVWVYVGVWDGKSGRFWIDDLGIEEVGLSNIVRRQGTPISIKSDETGIAYQEGRDFAQIRVPKVNLRSDPEPLAIKIPPQSRIRNGERLRVSYYQRVTPKKGQITVCMSDPRIYEIWQGQAKLIHQHLSPNKYMLSMDEIRAGGSCETCKKRNMSMAQILGDCISRQVKIVREVSSNAEVFIWSDMLDPNHNAHAHYYLVDGDFTDSWKYIPKDIVIVCWYYQKRNESLRFFSSRGFRTMAGAYYDGDNLDNPKGWLEALDRTPGACGIMYTTWRNKYDLLDEFGDLVKDRTAPKQ